MAEILESKHGHSTYGYSSMQLSKEAAYLRREVRKSSRSQGYEPQFIPGFVIRIGNDKDGRDTCLSIYYRLNGLLQVSNMAL